MSKMAKPRVITLHDSQFKDACRKLAAEVARAAEPQLIIGILNGGGEVGRLIHKRFPGAEYAEPSLRRKSSKRKSRLAKLLRKLPTAAVDTLRLFEARRLERKPKDSIAPFTLPEEVASAAKKAKSILIVDDAVDSGMTMLRVRDAVKKAAPADASIFTAAITVTTSNPLINPDFALFRNKTLIRFPWSNDYRPDRPAPDPCLPDHMNGLAVVADMDCTLLSINSWPVFAKAVLFRELSRGNWSTAWRLFSLHRASHNGKANHREVKHAFAKRSREYPKQFFDCLTDKLTKKVNRQVERILREAASRGAAVIIATAAAAEYSRPLLKHMGFSHIISSSAADCPIDQYVETKGNIKAKAVERMLNDLNLKAYMVLTDNGHDLPLLQTFGEARRVLVRPTAKSIDQCGAYADLILP